MLLRTLLHPWYDVLRKMRATYEDYVLWLYFASTHVTEHAAAFHLEGVELLAWLGRVSKADLLAVVSELWPKCLDACAQSSEHRVGIVLRVGIHGFAATRVCCSPRLGGIKLSSGYVKTRDAIQDELRGQQQLDPSERLDRPEVLVHLFVRATDRHLKEIFEFVADLASITRSENDGINEATFHEINVRLTKVELTESSDHVLTDDFFGPLVQLATRGVKLVTRSVLQFDVHTRATAQAKFEGLEKLLATGELATEATLFGRGMDELGVQPSLVDVGMAASLFSAVASNRSLRKVHVKVDAPPWFGAFGDAAITARPVQWLTVALFSRLAHHSVEQICLELGWYDPINDMEEVLLADDPLAVVFSDHAISIRGHQHLRATASRFVLFNPADEMTAGATDSVVVHTHEHTTLRVISHDTCWWSVLLPAWGQAWVRDHDIVITRHISVPVAQTGNHCIRRIEVSSVCFLSEVESLVRTMNPHVEELVVRGEHLADPDDAWSRVVSSLPYLRELDVEPVLLDQLKMLLDTFASLHVPRSLTRLKLGVRFSTHDHQLPTAFVDALTDPLHRLTECLEALTIVSKLPWESVAMRTLAFQTCDLLDGNQRLRSVQLKGGAGIVPRLVKKSLGARNGIFLPGRLGLRAKIAFLSSIDSSPAGDSGGLPSLDSEALSLIFQFAARCPRREVLLKR